MRTISTIKIALSQGNTHWENRTPVEAISLCPSLRSGLSLFMNLKVPSWLSKAGGRQGTNSEERNEAHGYALSGKG